MPFFPQDLGAAPCFGVGSGEGPGALEPGCPWEEVDGEGPPREEPGFPMQLETW